MATTWTAQGKPGQGWKYNEAGVSYNELGYLYNSIGGATTWSYQTKN